MADLKKIIESQNMNVRDCANKAGIPYSTLFDLTNGKTKLENASGATLYRLSKTLGMDMEELLFVGNSADMSASFEGFKSGILHELKTIGRKKFMLDTVKNKTASKYWNNSSCTEALYIVGLMDYLCRISGIPKYEGYNGLRRYRLQELKFPGSVEVESIINESCRQEALACAIPEFLERGIVEGGLDDVC